MFPPPLLCRQVTDLQGLAVAVSRRINGGIVIPPDATTQIIIVDVRVVLSACDGVLSLFVLRDFIYPDRKTIEDILVFDSDYIATFQVKGLS